MIGIESITTEEQLFEYWRSSPWFSPREKRLENLLAIDRMSFEDDLKDLRVLDIGCGTADRSLKEGIYNKGFYEPWFLRACKMHRVGKNVNDRVGIDYFDEGGSLYTLQNKKFDIYNHIQADLINCLIPERRFGLRSLVERSGIDIGTGFHIVNCANLFPSDNVSPEFEELVEGRSLDAKLLEQEFFRQILELVQEGGILAFGDKVFRKRKLETGEGYEFVLIVENLPR
jgi:hypothetical protein